MLIPFLFVTVSLNYLLYKMSAVQSDMLYQAQDGIFAITMKMNYMFLLGFPLIFVVIFVLGVSLSHRFAGPLKRIRSEIDNIAETGDLVKRLHIRKGDDIKPLVDSINKLLDYCAGNRR